MKPLLRAAEADKRVHMRGERDSACGHVPQRPRSHDEKACLASARAPVEGQTAAVCRACCRNLLDRAQEGPGCGAGASGEDGGAGRLNVLALHQAVARRNGGAHRCRRAVHHDLVEVQRLKAVVVGLERHVAAAPRCVLHNNGGAKRGPKEDEDSSVGCPPMPLCGGPLPRPRRTPNPPAPRPPGPSPSQRGVASRTAEISVTGGRRVVSELQQTLVKPATGATLPTSV
jgi:hypothetical protein